MILKILDNSLANYDEARYYYSSNKLYSKTNYNSYSSYSL